MLVTLLFCYLTLRKAGLIKLLLDVKANMGITISSLTSDFIPSKNLNLTYCWKKCPWKRFRLNFQEIWHCCWSEENLIILLLQEQRNSDCKIPQNIQHLTIFSFEMTEKFIKTQTNFDKNIERIFIGFNPSNNYGQRKLTILMVKTCCNLICML